MQELINIGKNKTGAKVNPQLTQEMRKNAEELTAKNLDKSTTIEDLRSQYIEESEAVGSIPLPEGAELPNATLVQLIDKLGERLAFERSSVRLYEALLTKCRASKLDLPTARIENIQQQELEHFLILKAALEKLGADPTVMTPCADVAAVSSMGLFQVVTDPRTNVAQCLSATLTAELTDNAAWELLMELCENAGRPEVAQPFVHALEQEREHLQIIKSLLQQVTLQNAKGERYLV